MMDPEVGLMSAMVRLPDRSWPLLLFLLKPGQDEFYTAEFRAAGMLWVQRADQLDGRLLPRANGHIMAAGPLFPLARASYDLVDVVVTSAFSRARFPVERQHSVSQQWIESASPGGAVVALGPVGLVPYLGRPPRPKRLARILQQAASQGNLVAGLLSVLRTEG
jgi:hypothetical protein